MNELCSKEGGNKAVIMDLSGAFRIKDKNKFAEFYGCERHAEE
jgi:N-acetyl-gamma-glutamyl-phosphate reductase